MISKRSETLSDMGRTPWVEERSARGHEAQPGVGRQQPPMGPDVQAVAERGKCDCAHVSSKTIQLQLKKQG